MSCKPILSLDEFQEYLKTHKTILKYDSSDEKKAPHPWWNLDKRTIQSILKHISERTVTCTKGAIGLDKELQHVANTATRLENVDRGPSIKVALIGAQGAGKSLFINAIFDCTGLSLTGAKGFACTSAIVRYAYGSGDNFSAEVQFLNAAMREQMVDEHTRSYLAYHNDLDDTDDEDGAPRTRSFKQDEIDRKRKNTAEDFFDTIFGSRDDFLSAWSSDPINTGEFKNLCLVKCTEAMEQYDMTSKGMTHFSKGSPAELLEEVKPFLSNVDDKVCLWPIVDCVTIRSNHPLLQEGVEIIDLPGSGDANMLRARHADEVKNTVDYEIILGDTVRIGTDDTVISTVRAAVLNHGASKVKVIATKIDVLSDDQLMQYSGTVFDTIKRLLEIADKDSVIAEDDGNDAKVNQINRYKLYLERYRKSHAIRERAEDISKKLGVTLSALTPEGSVEIIHTSTSDYMNWIKSDNIPFNSQPALSPEETGVPRIRNFLYSLRSSQNFSKHANHIEKIVPAFVEKLVRVVTQSDRDAGFGTIADDFDDLRARFLRDMVTQIKWCFQVNSLSGIKKIKKDTKAYKAVVKAKVQNHWLILKSGAFNRVLKSRGTVPQGTSKARGLEKSVNWNAELAAIFTPSLNNWSATHTELLKLLRTALPPSLDRLYMEAISLMNSSQANLITVEKAKFKFDTVRHRMKSKLMAMLDEMATEQDRLLIRATLKDERENNMISALTDNIFDDVCGCAPALKVTTSGKPKRYVTPIFRFKKDRFETHFLDEEAHFVDRFIDSFQEQLDERMNKLIDKHFGKLTAMFEDYTKLLREHTPVDFTINPKGLAVRVELEKNISYFEEQAELLRSLLPIDLTKENESIIAREENPEDNNGQVQDLKYFLERASKRKRDKGDAPTSVKREPEPKGKRIKCEDA